MQGSSTPENEKKEEEKLVLSVEQQLAFDAVKRGRNIFITGSAGVGKSFLLNELIRSQPSSRGVYITASTGVAACNVNGTTLHSFASIGLGDKPAYVLADNIVNKRAPDVRQRWKNCRLLVIDEISMIDGHLFSKVEEVARMVRSNNKPFGGIQVILCGDFFQLPPVKKNCFAFETQAWKDVVDETIVLKKVFRQKLVGFVSLLNRLRIGHLTALDIEVLMHSRRTLFSDDGIQPTRLFPHKFSCNDVNQRELAKLPGTPFTYTAQDWWKDLRYKEQLEKNCRYCQVLHLKLGAQVMLLNNQNVAGGLVNGARGVVIGFKNKKKEIGDHLKEMIEIDPHFLHTEYGKEVSAMYENCMDDIGYPIVKFVNNIEEAITPEKISTEVAGKTVSFRIQVPLALAWAVSVHKSQGMTMDRVDIDISRAFEHGQSYVALSRVTSLDGLLLRDFDPSKITAHPKVIEYYRQIDPQLHQFMQGGEDELKKVIERKKNPEQFLKEQQEKIKAKDERETLNRLISSEHNYVRQSTFVTELLHKKDTTRSLLTPQRRPIPSARSLNLEDMMNAGETLPTPHLQTAPAQVLVVPPDAISISPGKSQYIVLNGQRVKITTQQPQTTPSPTSNALKLAEERLAGCRKALAEVSNFDAEADASGETACSSSGVPTDGENPFGSSKISFASESADAIQSTPMKGKVELERNVQDPLFKNICQDLLDASQSEIFPQSKTPVRRNKTSTEALLTTSPAQKYNFSPRQTTFNCFTSSQQSKCNKTSQQSNSQRITSSQQSSSQFSTSSQQSSSQFSTSSQQSSSQFSTSSQQSSSQFSTSSQQSSSQYSTLSQNESSNNSTPSFSSRSEQPPKDAYIQAMLKAKKQEIEEKRKQALMKRLVSMRKNNR